MSDETKTCERFLNWFGREYAFVVENVIRPDKIPGPGKKVDYAFTAAGRRHVLEHTIFSSSIMKKFEDANFKRLVWPLDGRPVGPYILVTEGRAEDYSAGCRNLAATQAAIVAWVKSAASLLPRGGAITETPATVGFKLSLTKRLGDSTRGLMVGRRSRSHFPEAATDLRASAAKVVEDKLQKLADAKGQGDRSILLLECDDMGTAGGWNLIPAMVNELRSTSLPLPDLVYLIETMPTTQQVSIIKHDLTIFEDERVFGWIDENGFAPPL